MADTKLLVPLSFTVHDKKVLDYVSETYLRNEDVKIFLFCTYTPPPEVDTTQSPELVQRLKDGISYMSQEKSKRERGLKLAKQNLVAQGFAPDQIEYVFKKRVKPLADEMIAAISSKNCGILVLSLQGSKTAPLFSRSVHNRVLSVLESITVAILK